MKHIVFCLLIATSLGARAEEIRTLVLGQSIASREARASEYDKASAVSSHSEVSFQIADHAETRVGQIQLAGYLINSSSSRVSVYLAGRDSVLRLEIAESNDIKFRTDLPKQTPAPSASLFVLDLPARTRVQFTGVAELGRLIYTGTPTVTLKWTFDFWTPPKPSGALQFQMPSLQQAKLDPFKIEIQKFNAAAPVFGGTTATAEASLRNISLEPQLFCRSLQASFYWDLRDAKGEKLKNREELTVESTEAPIQESMCTIIEPGKAVDLDTIKIVGATDAFEFQSRHLNIGSLKPGLYQIHLKVLNLASGASAKDLPLINRLIQSHHAANPTPSIETGTPFSIP